jgi:hypothetical protein
MDDYQLSRVPAPVILTFGGGINAQRRSLDIDPQECTTGENFNLDPEVSIYRRRAPFDLVATVPNAQSIRGYGQVTKRDGSIKTAIQAGANIYSWDGVSSFTLVGTVSAGSRMRGPAQNNYPLNDYVLMTDLNKLTVVSTWDGTNFGPLAHNLSSPLYAKHCHVHDERAFFGNVKSGTDTPSVLLASKIGDPTNLTTSGRPSSALADDDPFFLQTLDLRPINGLEQAWRTFFISSENGHLHALTGSSAKDFALDSLWEGSEAAGEEALANMGNDVAVAVQGRIESLRGTLNYGDIITNNLSIYLTTLVKSYTDWTVAYNRRLRKAYFFPTGSGVIYVLHKDLLDLGQAYYSGQPQQGSFSPWSKWTTQHEFAFTPTCVMPMKNPVSGFDEVYCGDASGNIFKLEGSGGQDGGTQDLIVTRTSGAFRIPDASIFNFRGYVFYEQIVDATLTITFLMGGVSIRDQDVVIDLKGLPGGGSFYGGGSYYGGGAYYNASFSGRLSLQDFAGAGLSDLLQIEASVTGAVDFAIHEIGIIFEAASR